MHCTTREIQELCFLKYLIWEVVSYLIKKIFFNFLHNIQLFELYVISHFLAVEHLAFKIYYFV